MTIKILATCIFATTLLFSGCKKGDTGPAGPTGATGTSGSANVTTTTGSVIAWSSLNPGWEVAIPTPALTAAVQGKAAVEVFLSIDTAKHWIALPYTTLTGGIAIMSFTTSTNLVT
ncbi:MAG TPA: hypothetical protein VNX68_00105, partial [Nitrosopumilaceae archaeon]|nr:hypothetical protein [Nitrosopumilaceae archaeon]